MPETSQIVPETPSVEMPPIQTPSTEPEQVGGTETETETGVELETGIDQSGGYPRKEDKSIEDENCSRQSPVDAGAVFSLWKIS